MQDVITCRYLFFSKRDSSLNVLQQTTAAHAIGLPGSFKGVHGAFINPAVDGSSIHAEELCRIRALDKLRVVVAERTPYPVRNNSRVRQIIACSFTSFFYTHTRSPAHRRVETTQILSRQNARFGAGWVAITSGGPTRNL
jgi:hypothetical protein